MCLCLRCAAPRFAFARSLACFLIFVDAPWVAWRGSGCDHNFNSLGWDSINTPPYQVGGSKFYHFLGTQKNEEPTVVYDGTRYTVVHTTTNNTERTTQTTTSSSSSSIILLLYGNYKFQYRTFLNISTFIASTPLTPLASYDIQCRSANTHNRVYAFHGTCVQFHNARKMYQYLYSQNDEHKYKYKFGI